MNGSTNGTSIEEQPAPVIDVPVKGADGIGIEVVSIDCSELPADPRDLCELLSSEDADPKYWIKLAFEYRRILSIDQAVNILNDGLNSRAIQRDSSQRFQFHSLLASLYIEKARRATTGVNDQSSQETKEHWQHQALQSLNDAARLNPQGTNIAVTKGILQILKSDKERSALDEAYKHFETALQANSRNLYAILGKARVMYSRKNYKSALAFYQRLLTLRPDLTPDPRIGIGLCYWELGMKDEALFAWERSLEVHPTHVAPLLLIGIHHVAKAFSVITDEDAFQQYYTKGITLVSKAYKLQPMALAGVVLASHFYTGHKLDKLQTILERVLQYTDNPTIKADALFWIGRGQHSADILDKAMGFYQVAIRTDPELTLASLAIGQLQLAREDITDAKLTFEGVLEKNPKCIEALAVLGSLYAREVLDPAFKADTTGQAAKAKAYLDKAISLTDENKLRHHNDPSLHFIRAMLAEHDTPSHVLRVLERAADIQVHNEMSQSPQILNNMAVVYAQEGNYELARDVYQRAIEGCIKNSADDAHLDGDALIATMTYNLGRCEEQSGNTAQAREIYQGLIGRYADYVEPAARLCYMDAVEGKVDEAAEVLRNLMEVSPTNTEVRGLYGWLLQKQKKNKALHFNEDPERKHFNHTLKYVDNYERYSLVALGNFYIRLARETRADNDAGKAERNKHYDMSIKFFERALHYDPKNAYAAQGLGIAYAEHKQYQKAITIFSKVRESIREESIFLNMGHCLCELHQYSRAIENYETALNTFHNGKNLNLYQCLGRAWLSRGREEKNADHLREALRFAKLALAEDPRNTSIQFNVAFIQFQFAEVLRTMPELNRSVADLEEASAGLDAAVKSFTLLAEHKQPPYPKSDIVQRATMGKNTTTKQLERAIQAQREYESKNSAKVAEAKAKREADRANREAAAQEAQKAELARQAVLADQRRQMQEDARKSADKRREEELEREEREQARIASKKERKGRKNREAGGEESDEVAEDGEPRKSKSKSKKKRSKRGSKRSKLDDGSDSDVHSENDENGDSAAPAKKRKTSKKYISAEMVDSEDDLDMPDTVGAQTEDHGGNAYANESMLADRETDRPDMNEPLETGGEMEASAMAIAPTSSVSHPPVTNQPDQENSVL